MEFTSLDDKKSEKWKAIEDSCYNFLKTNFQPQFDEILNSEEKDKAHFSINVGYFQIFEDSPKIGETLLRSPELIFQRFDTAAKRVLIDKYEAMKQNFQNGYLTLTRDALKSKLNLHVRINGLPNCETLEKKVFPSCNETGNLLALVGTVVRVGTTKLLEYSKMYQCNRCKETVEVTAPPTRYHAFPKFAECPNLCVNGKVTPMAKENFKNAESCSKFRDYQELKLQEQTLKMEFGSMPKAITVVCEDDLVDSCKPGDDVKITGYLYLRWKPFKPGFPYESELVFRANYVQVNNEKVSIKISDDTPAFAKSFWNHYKYDVFEGRNHIIMSFCPQIYGMYVVKLAMCMVLAGGVSKDVAGTRVRGESHMLLVGDPGTGKSQLLKYASKICPRSVLTTGIGTSSAGLTVSAVKDQGEWHLEAGALVLADGGVCCIDEFSCIKEHDRTSIHEAMEQQSISIAKAGMVVKLPTRVTMIAATNPKGRYDPEQPLSINIAIASPLLSRFDIVMVLLDAQSDEWDNLISDFILAGKDIFNEAIKNAEATDILDADRLQSYLVHIKDLDPQMTDDANTVICQYYKYQRNLESRNAARTTVRLLESLRRLSEGHARLMYRSEVQLHDAISAISVIETSMGSSSMGPCGNNLHTNFPSDPLTEYATQARVILEKLGLHDIWEKEKIVLDNLKIQRAKRNNGLNTSPPPPKRSTQIRSHIQFTQNRSSLAPRSSQVPQVQNQSQSQSRVSPPLPPRSTQVQSQFIQTQGSFKPPRCTQVQNQSQNHAPATPVLEIPVQLVGLDDSKQQSSSDDMDIDTIDTPPESVRAAIIRSKLRRFKRARVCNESMD